MTNQHLLFGLVFLFLASCGKKVPIKTITQEKNKWEAINTGSYQYTLDANCKCAITNYTPALIIVKADTIHEIIDPISKVAMVNPLDSSLVQDSLKDWFYTIDDLYELLEDSKGVYSREVEFDVQDHFPTLISIDQIRRAYDDEIYFTAADLAWK